MKKPLRYLWLDMTKNKYKQTEIGTIPKDWEIKKVGELYNISSGLSKPRNEFGFGYPFLSFKTIFDNSAIPRQLGELVNSTEKEREKCSIKRGDVFLTRTSETVNELGMSSVALRDYDMATFNGFAKRLRPKDKTLLPEFSVYLFRSQKVRSQIQMVSSLTTRASLNAEAIRRLNVIIPSIDEQKSIAKILSDLDVKIEINTQINSNLKAISQAIYKRWFVDFEFPDENGSPYRSSGGEMVDSELGKIPNGWSVKPIDEIADFLNGLALQKYPPNNDKDILPVIKIRELKQGITDSTDMASSDIPSDYIVEDGDILFSWSGSLDVCIWGGGKGALNQHLFKVTSKEYEKWFYYHWIKYHLPEYQHIARGKATTMGHIQRKHLSASMVLVPKKEQLCLMDEIISPIIERVINNMIENERLIIIRDSLLPRLMSGRIRVGEVFA